MPDKIEQIEQLETRRLLSATPNPGNVAADESAVWFDIQRIYSEVYTAGTKLIGDAQSIGADIKRLSNTPQIQALNQTLNNDLSSAGSKLWNDALAVFNAGAADAWNVITDGIALYFDQWNPSAFPAAQTKLASDEAKLQTDIAPSVAVLKQDFNTAANTIGNDVKAIADAFSTDPQLKTDQQAFATDLGATVQSLGTDAQTLAGDVATLLTDQSGTA